MFVNSNWKAETSPENQTPFISLGVHTFPHHIPPPASQVVLEVEIPSEHMGVVSEVYVKTGDKISPNDKILELEQDNDSQKKDNEDQENLQNESEKKLCAKFLKLPIIVRTWYLIYDILMYFDVREK